MRLFGRACAVTVGSLRITGLRIQFKIEKTLQRDPNKLDLTITNLSADTRRQVQFFVEMSDKERKKRGLPEAMITIEAGYKSETRIIFVGDVRWISHVRQGASWETKIHAGDGEKAQQQARVNQSHAPGTPLAAVVGGLAKKITPILPASVQKILAGGLPGGFDSFANGISLHGPAASHLDSLLKTAGYTWSMQDGVLQFQKVDKATDDVAVVLGPESGLIGSPEFGEKGVLKAKSLLQPDLKPGRKVSLQSSSATGVFKVEHVVHSGDTHGQDWYSEVELKRLW